MSRIWFVRHGQAGTRDAYDSLSELGRRQARLLGEYFVAEEIRFDAAYRGGMLRQEATATEVEAVYRANGLAFPEATVDPGWNEFDLDQIYRVLGPQLAAVDPEFQREYAEMLADVRAAENSPDADVHRRWRPCDVKVVRAWISGQFACEGESWLEFRDRVADRRDAIGPLHPDANVVVFTSATPISVWAALAMDIHDGRAMKLAGVMHNTACTVIRLHANELRLHTFNAVPHLTSGELRTYR